MKTENHEQEEDSKNPWEDIGEAPCPACKKPMPDVLSWCSDECFKKLCTCTKCPSNKECEYAFDEYNTGSDCLAEK